METGDHMSISVIIPTLNAGDAIGPLLESLDRQTHRPLETIIIDSSSDDRTVDIVEQFKCRIKTIERREFRHGATRNLGASFAQGDALVFLTQDSLPNGEQFLARLVHPLQTRVAAASTARQIPGVVANPIERFSRLYNYPEQSHLRSIKDLSDLGIKTYFFSNSAAAYDREIFWSLNGFDETVIAIEDMELCARLLNAGHATAYTTEAQVIHSHNAALVELFRRYFDTGVFHFQRKDLFSELNSTKEGLRFIREASSFLVSNRYFKWIPRLFLESMVKWSAFRLGYNYSSWPTAINSKLSGTPFFWG